MAVREECGVFGIYAKERGWLGHTVCAGLYALQHRGQDSAGIVVNDRGVFTSLRQPGLVSEVFSEKRLLELGQGNIAVGHVRYATTGGQGYDNLQPVLIRHHKGRFALCHNGNLTNAGQLRRAQEESGHIFHSSTDSEVIAQLIVQHRMTSGSMEEAVGKAMEELEGAYSLVLSSPRKLIAARDPMGFRPLCMGLLPDGSLVFASESCALDAAGAKLLRAVEPGEIVTVSPEGVHCDRSRCGHQRHLCLFEYIYFARPDSVIDGIPVQEARFAAGKILAQSHPVDADVVVGVPDSGLDAAAGYARESGIPLVSGFVKNKYIARTFIAPDQQAREQGVRIKLNAIRSAVAGKRIVLVDDSIVRGTTCRHIISLLKEAGAKEVHMRISAPPFIAPCYYGTDIDSTDHLIAAHCSVEEICRQIGADSLGFLPLERAAEMAGGQGLCLACFNGKFPTTPPEGDKSRFEAKLVEL